MDNDKFQELVLKHFDKVFQQLGTMQEEINKVRQSQARMEHEHGEKLSALFDGYKLLSEKLDDHTVRLERIEEKVTDHDIRIEVLNKTKATKRKAK